MISRPDRSEARDR